MTLGIVTVLESFLVAAISAVTVSVIFAYRSAPDFLEEVIFFVTAVDTATLNENAVLIMFRTLCLSET